MYFMVSSFFLIIAISNGVIFIGFGKMSQPNLSRCCNKKRCIPRKKKQLVKEFSTRKINFQLVKKFSTRKINFQLVK